VVPLAELEAAALQMARTIAGYPPLGVRHAKLGFDLAADADLHAALTYELDAELTCFAEEEVRANLRAFANRKKSARRPSAGAGGGAGVRIDLPAGAWLEHDAAWLAPAEADAALAALRDELTWEQREIVLFGRRVLQPRLIAWAGDLGYRYSGQTLEPRAFTE